MDHRVGVHLTIKQASSVVGSSYISTQSNFFFHLRQTQLEKKEKQKLGLMKSEWQ